MQLKMFLFLRINRLHLDTMLLSSMLPDGYLLRELIYRHRNILLT
jgi:hypothetical protein